MEHKLPVDEGIAELLAEAIDWMESQGGLNDLLTEKRANIVKDWIHENFHDVGADHWYFPKCEECKKAGE